MRRLLVFGVGLVCAAHMLSCAALEEIKDGRCPLYISARDPNGGKLFFTWKQLPNEAPQVKIADPNAARLENGKWISETYFIATEPGKYQFEVSVKNEAGEESKKVFQKEVLAPTPPPVAVPGKDQEGVKLGDAVVLDGGGSTASGGQTIAAWDWSVLKAPGDFKVDPLMLKQRTFEFKAAEAGLYQFELKVSDGRKWSLPARTTVTVLPPTPPPVAAAGKDQTRTAGDAVKIDGAESKAAEGLAIAAWEWRVVEAPLGFTLDQNAKKEKAFEFKPEAAGVYMFELRVSDGKQWSAPSRTTVTVAAPVPPPVAVAGKDQSRLVGDTVKVDGSESKATGGQAITGWQWRVAKAPAPFALDPNLLKEKAFEFKPEEAGEYVLELRVSADGRRWSEPALTKVLVAAPVPPPVAAAGKDQACSAGDLVKIDGSESKAAEGLAIADWEWKVAQGPPGFSLDAKLLKQKTFEFKPEAAGVYRFELRVFDGKKWSEPARTAVAAAPPIPPPVAAPGKDQTRTVGEVVRLNGVDSKANGELPISAWEWRVVEAPPKFKLDPKHLKEKSFDFKAQEAGVYKFELRVNDSRKWSDPAPVTVTITPGKPPAIEDTAPSAVVELPPTPSVVEHKAPEIKVVVAPGKTVKAGETIVLDGSKSVVDEALKPEFFWRQEAGQGPLARQLAPDKSKPFSQVRLSDPLNFPIWTCKPEQPGEYKFVLEVTTRTQSGGTETAAKTEGAPVVYRVEGAGQAENVTPPPPVPPPPAEGQPVANISTEHAQVAAGDMVKLDGSKSTGTQLEYIWAPVPGKRYPKSWAGTDGPQVQFKAEEEGEYAVALMVKDSSGKFSAPAQIVVKVGPAGRPPAIKLAKSYECVVGEQLRVEAEATDPDGTQLEYKWTCVDPPDLVIPDRLAKNSILVFVPRNVGAYVFKVVVTNAKGLSESAQTMVGVKDALTRPPTAIIEGPKKPVGTGAKVALSGARSSDPAKKPLTYLWKQEDGPGGVKVPGNVPGERDKEWDFIPTEQGRYVFSLVVSNGVSKSDPDKFELTVTKANNPPAAAIIGPPGGRLALGEQTTLDGSTSSDPDNDKLTFKWRKAQTQPKAGTKPGDIELTGADQEKATIKGVAAGLMRVELVVNDGTVDSDPAFIDLNIVRPNNPPVAKITGPATAKPGDVVELSAAESNDPDSDEITYVWSQPSDGGPEIGVRGKDLRKKILKFKPERSGMYVINLQVVDSGGMKSELVTHKLEVKGIPKAPLAVATRVGNEAVSVGSEVKLSARGSHDPDGTQLTYKWKQVGGEFLAPFTADGAVEGEVVNVVPNAAGKYSFELVANNGALDSKPAALSFVAKAANKPPLAVIGEVTPCEPGERVALDGSASHDPDGDKLEYRWSQVSGPDAKFSWHGTGKPRTEVQLPKEGEYVFELKVFDGKEWSEPAHVAVKTRAGNQPPVAAFTVPELRTEENVEAVLDASASSDPDNGPKPLSYLWKQFSGSKTELTAEGPKARFTPKKAGNYIFQVRVSDGKAESAPAEIKVEVLKAGALPVAVPVAKPNPVKVAQKGNKDDPNILELNGEKSRPGASGTALTYQWKQVGGEDLSIRPADLSKSRVGLRIFRPGTYRFMLVVSDGQNSSSPAYLDVEVIGSGSTGVPAHGDSNKTDAVPPKTEAPPAPPAPEGKTPKTTSEAPAPSVVSPLSPQLQALTDLAGKPGPEAEKTLIEALSSSNAEVRSTAAVALSKRGQSAVPALIAVLETGSAPAKKEAHFALREISHETISLDADKWKQWWAKASKQGAEASSASTAK